MNVATIDFNDGKTEIVRGFDRLEMHAHSAVFIWSKDGSSKDFREMLVMPLGNIRALLAQTETE